MSSPLRDPSEPIDNSNVPGYVLRSAGVGRNTPKKEQSALYYIALCWGPYGETPEALTFSALQPAVSMLSQHPYPIGIVSYPKDKSDGPLLRFKSARPDEQWFIALWKGNNDRTELPSATCRSSREGATSFLTLSPIKIGVVSFLSEKEST